MIHTVSGTVCGLLGKTLGHSFSPQIHGELADYEYKLFEVPEESLGDFLRNGGFHALNVTIPYKQAVIPYLSEISDRARRIGAVNTVLRRPDGTLFGDNTDYDGFLYIVRRSGIGIKDKKVLVIGSGGTSRTVSAVLDDLGAGEIRILSHRENTPEIRARYADTDVIVNTSQEGMYPKCGTSPLPLAEFPGVSGVLDVIFNPARTALLIDAESRGIPCINGLPMLVAQAKRASELFTGMSIPDGEVERITAKIAKETANLVLVGMPGSGKSTVGRLCAEALGREFIDTDRMITECTGKKPGEIISESGEAEFRRIEHECVALAGKRTGVVIATGGGVVTRGENYAPLHQNGVTVFLRRALDTLPTEGRPLSAGNLEEMYRERLPFYQSFSDACVDSQPEVADTVQLVLEAFEV